MSKNDILERPAAAKMKAKRKVIFPEKKIRYTVSFHTTQKRKDLRDLSKITGMKIIYTSDNKKIEIKGFTLTETNDNHYCFEGDVGNYDFRHVPETGLSCKLSIKYNETYDSEMSIDFVQSFDRTRRPS